MRALITFAAIAALTACDGEPELSPAVARWPASTELYAVSCTLGDGSTLKFQATNYQYGHSVGWTFRTEDGKKVETTYDCIVVQLK